MFCCLCSSSDYHRYGWCIHVPQILLHLHIISGLILYRPFFPQSFRSCRLCCFKRKKIHLLLLKTTNSLALHVTRKYKPHHLQQSKHIITGMHRVFTVTYALGVMSRITRFHFVSSRMYCLVFRLVCIAGFRTNIGVTVCFPIGHWNKFQIFSWRLRWFLFHVKQSWRHVSYTTKRGLQVFFTAASEFIGSYFSLSHSSQWTYK